MAFLIIMLLLLFFCSTSSMGIASQDQMMTQCDSSDYSMGMADQDQMQRCIYSREDHLRCKYKNKDIIRAGDNQYSVHFTKISPTRKGGIKCRVKALDQIVSDITTFGTSEMRVIYSPGYPKGEQYDCKLRVEYKVRCQPKEVAFYIMTHLKIQGKEDCQYNGRNVCQDYVWVIRGQAGYVEECGNTISNRSLSQLVFEGFDVVFRTSEDNITGEGFQMYSVCSKPEEALQPGCFEVSEFNCDTSSSQHKRCACKAHHLQNPQSPSLPPAIDPRGLLPDADEEIELIAMYTPLLNSIKYDSRNKRSGEVANPRVFDESDKEAVLAALRSNQSCNAVLRAQSRATLTYYSVRYPQNVVLISTFSISCNLTDNELSCNSDIATLRNRTMCNIDSQPPLIYICEPFLEAEVIMIDIDQITVTAINCLGQTAVLVVNKSR